MTVKDNCKVLDKSTVEQLTSVVQDRNVLRLCNQLARPEGGCGVDARLAHLDQITAQSNNIINPSRPACLWMATTANLLKMPGVAWPSQPNFG
jgi:hypothetical protein